MLGFALTPSIVARASADEIPCSCVFDRASADYVRGGFGDGVYGAFVHDTTKTNMTKMTASDIVSGTAKIFIA
jgi:hypothetical protein